MKGKHKNYKEIKSSTFDGIDTQGATKYNMETV